MTRITEAERIAGKRADFLVHYTRNGRRYFDAMWGSTEDEARTKFNEVVRELRWTVEIIAIEPVQVDA